MLVAALTALYKYGDRTDLADKSLKGTNEALEALRAYVSRALAEAVKPTVERIIDKATSLEEALEVLRGESFLDDVSSFVNRDMDDILFYRNLSSARTRWSVWARRISWGIYVLLIVQFVFTSFFYIAGKMLGIAVSLPVLLVTVTISGMLAAYCFVCYGVMLYYHDQISKYRDKVL